MILMAGIAFVNSNPDGSPLNNFNDVAVLRLGVKEGTYVGFARVGIQNDDGDSQNATARITLRDGADLSDRVDVRIPGNTRDSLSLQGTLRVDPGKTEIVDVRCSTFRGFANQSSLFAVQVTELRFD
jgi:hypothetical protein